MKPLKKATIPPSEVEGFLADAVKKWLEGDSTLRAMIKASTLEEAEAWIGKVLADEALSEIWLNETYQVSVRQRGGCFNLSIKRLDRQPCHDWRDLQEIKNQLVGAECEAVELYPAESRRVDTSNQYHLFCIPDNSFRFPFGFTERVVSDTPIFKSVNRPLK